MNARASIWSLRVGALGCWVWPWAVQKSHNPPAHHARGVAGAAPLGSRAGLLLLLVVAALLSGCWGPQPHRRSLEADLRPVGERFDDGEAERPLPEGRLEGYLAYAMARSPALRASYGRWRAAVAQVGVADALPAPVLSYGLFVRQVETRVGPQRHRFGLRQRLPWPEALSTSSDVAAAGARAAQRRFEAQALVLQREVGESWWRLWAIARRREVRREQLALLRQLAESARGRLEVGAASVSEVNRIDLSVSRLADALDALTEAERAASARLAAAIGAPAGSATPIEEEPFVALLPDEEERALVAAVLGHPAVLEQEMFAEQSAARRRRAEADRYPDLTVGVDYIETGEREDADPADNGKDPVLATVSVELPIWFEDYAAAEQSAAASREARLAQRGAALDAIRVEVLDAMATLRDSERRVRLYRDTLIPQAETTWLAVLGDYETGRATVTGALMAFQELLELRLSLVEAQADHARSWVRLESAVGRPVRAKRRSSP